MSELFFALLLALGSCNAMADWVKVGSNGDLTTYVEPSTISKAGSSVSMWGVVDLKDARKEETGKSFLSAKSLQEYDCQAAQTKKITLSFFSANMGAGEVVHTYTDPEKWKWTPVPHGTIVEAMWKAACGKM